MIKSICKRIITCLQANILRLRIGKDVYIGFGIKVTRNKDAVIELGDSVKIRPSVTFFAHNSNSKLILGNGSEIGNHSTISSYNKIIFEDYVLTGPNVYIADHNHKYDDVNRPIALQGVLCEENSCVYVGEGSWIGANSVIVGDVRIGKHVVIGANSVVVKDIPDYTVAVGSPAKVVKKYNKKTGKYESTISK